MFGLQTKSVPTHAKMFRCRGVPYSKGYNYGSSTVSIPKWMSPIHPDLHSQTHIFSISFIIHFIKNNSHVIIISIDFCFAIIVSPCCSRLYLIFKSNNGYLILAVGTWRLLRLLQQIKLYFTLNTLTFTSYHNISPSSQNFTIVA